MYWNPHEVLSYNALFHFITGNRGAGKTYGSKKLGIKHFKKKGRKFIYLRRYKSEFDDFGNFFADVSQEFPDDEFEVKGKKLFINGECCGYGVALSTALTKKSVSYHDVDYIFFDEFVIDSKVIHYLSNEVSQFLEFYETVARLRDNVRVLFLSNAVTVVNPYFLYWNMKPRNNQKFTRYGHMILENVKDQAFIDAKYKTKFGQIIKGTNYGNYAVENEFLKDNMNFVEKKTGDCKFEFSMVYNQYTYGIWADYKSGLIYMSKDIDPSNKIQFALTDQEHNPNVVLVRNVNRSFLLRNFVLAYEQGYLRFEDMSVKNQGLEIIGLLKGR
jgi:hypothetical protein